VQLGLPGSRLAINLTGVHPDQLLRGMVVAKPGTLQATALVDVRLRLVADDVRGTGGSPLRHNQAVDFFSGAAEVPARVRLLDQETVEPGGSAWVQLRLESPVALAAGDRFIIRQASPSLTIGGGQVVNPIRPGGGAGSRERLLPNWKSWRAARPRTCSCMRSQWGNRPL